MRRVLPLLCLFLLTSPAVMAGEDGSRRIPVTPDGGIAIVLSRMPDGETLWFVDGGESETPIAIWPRTWGRQVVSLHPSPDFRYVAVVAASEGHPVLTLFLTADLLEAARDSASDYSYIAHIFVINPYPGEVFCDGWDGYELQVVRYDEDGRRRDLQLDFSELPGPIPMGKSCP